MTIGCKLLTAEGMSLRVDGRVHYPVGEWLTVPGNGSYVAVTGGLPLRGVGRILAYFACCDPVEGVVAPRGVRCFRRVYRFARSAPGRISPELRGEVALYAPLSARQRIALARLSTPEWRGEVACYAAGLSAEQRLELARDATPEGRGRVARHAPGLSAAQRVALAEQSTDT